MPSNRTFILLAAAWFVSSAACLRADDWKTTDGKVYQDVKVIHTEPDAVTILHKDGGALVPLAKLPPDLQKRFNYDPAKAKLAAEARVKADAENARALQAEMDQASQLRRAGTVPQDNSALAANASPVDDVTEAAAAALAFADPSHHSIDDFSASANTLRRDLYDPTYHTMAHLAYSMRSLAPDPSDANHHSISEIANSGL